MAEWVQSIAFDMAKAGNTPGFCQQNVRKGYNIPPFYTNAITDWQHTQQHADRNIPTGISVPLFYNYKVDGHINVSLPDGRVWSDGIIYASLDDYEKKHPTVHYLGWGESVNNVPVIEKGAAMSVVGDRELSVLYRLRFGRKPDKGASGWLGKDFTEVDNALINSDEYKRVQAKAKAGTLNPLAFLPEDVQNSISLPTQSSN